MSTQPVSGSASVPAQPGWNPQRPSGMRYHRYRPVFDQVDVPITSRSWPDRRLVTAPLWVPVDLRDGNQALAEPMDSERRYELFSLLIRMGFKEIEIGYPSASQTDFEFARRLCLDANIPDDVTISAFTPARAELIDRTFDAMANARNALIHLCAPTAPTWRSVVLGASRAELLGMILTAAEQMLRRYEAAASSRTRFEFSPEVFNLTEPDYVLEVCNALTNRWDACADRPVVHNLPATVEIATPNIYADQIEYIDRNLARRDHVILSIHPHNDRGTGVAAAELAMLAGAQRVEGCLFGNGERTGNVDLVTLALNLFSQGIDPMVDLSAIDEIRQVVERCTRLPVHPRHPYAGDLVFTAFSGTHQDAIRKGFKRIDEDPATGERWEVPYLPIDPRDVGRSYAAVIRVNSQSGKGGVAYLLESEYGIRLPRPLQVEFSAIVQAASDASGRELRANELWDLFTDEYVCGGEVEISDLREEWRDHECTMSAELRTDGGSNRYSGSGADLPAAASDLLSRHGVPVAVTSSDVHQELISLAGPGYTGPRHFCLAQARKGDAASWGAGLADNPTEAVLQAILSCGLRSGRVRLAHQ
jgi:2-isopropylmalate synthase